MFKLLTGCACAVLLGLGCGKPQPSARAGASAAQKESPDVLCLSQPKAGADDASDRSLRELQSGLRAKPDDARRWVAAGEAWVRKARVQAQPDLYRQADACAQAAL